MIAPVIDRGRVAPDVRNGLAGGARAVAPWLLALVPYGFVIGVSAGRGGIPAFAGWLTGPLIFSGSAQVITIELLRAGAAPLVVIVAALAANLRLVLYSATLARHWKATPLRRQALAAYALVDPTLAVAVDAFEREGAPRARAHYAGAALALWVAWISAITAGVVIGTELPAGLRLDFVIPLFLLGEVVRRATTRAAQRGVLLAVVLAVACTQLPLHTGVLAAIAGGTVAALMRKEPTP